MKNELEQKWRKDVELKKGIEMNKRKQKESRKKNWKEIALRKKKIGPE